ncbi:hypothetical protein E2C01_012059 [Portunus trituberculatus]|uniref:Uncharacterized protein n=1 Tax=Portunus trituberculatus TaxID=210409 RepID=A0A5B7DCP7_PORTR|nr:hypothetical protein [Portunus trituberculatus]
MARKRCKHLTIPPHLTSRQIYKLNIHDARRYLLKQGQAEDTLELNTPVQKVRSCDKGKQTTPRPMRLLVSPSRRPSLAR